MDWTCFSFLHDSQLQAHSNHHLLFFFNKKKITSIRIFTHPFHFLEKQGKEKYYEAMKIKANTNTLCSINGDQMILTGIEEAEVSTEASLGFGW